MLVMACDAKDMTSEGERVILNQQERVALQASWARGQSQKLWAILSLVPQ